MRLLPALLLFSLLCACGQVGDLYLPETSAEPAPASAPVDESPKKKK